MASKTILLISANRYREPYPVYPLGVSYLKTYMDANLPGFNTEIFDCNLDTTEQLTTFIREQNPAYIGISLRNVDGADSTREGDFVGWYRELSGMVKSATTVPLIIGGSAFSMFPRQFMEALSADFGITGEGEETIVRLITAVENATVTDDIEGLVFRRGTDVIINQRTCHIQSPEVVFDSRQVDYYWKYSGMMNIQTKRGCPYKCIYCSYPVIDGRSVRVMDPEMVVDTILRLKRDKGVDYYFFTDSVFNIGDEFNHRLTECLIKSNARVKWGAYFAPKGLTHEKLEQYRASGLTHIEFGTESLSDECLSAYGKMFTFDDVVQASEVCLSLNIYYSHFLILGGYGETAGTLCETMENSKRLRHTVLFPFVGMRIYPDTELRNIAVRDGIIGENDDLFTPKYYISAGFDLDEAKRMAAGTGKAWIFPDEVPADIIEKVRLKLNKKGPAWEYLRKP